ncbi:hypothetical protein XBKB1_3240003 [Xenorhabdus bovienii str. kraussei Becker Underwood]|uniref:Uncharacterized protein n=1 Tax=Xenorhabdus bovienii str. kraussei Becker Underwood TaxID=1398204 RepID=A0A077PW14_XENBV|nr:hypothetical protein XBKB1_3240003 [Xenorhabdus bovienii str. kraussei Becker Underwood]
MSGSSRRASPPGIGDSICTTPPSIIPTPDITIDEPNGMPYAVATAPATTITAPRIVWKRPAFLLPMITGTIRMSSSPDNSSSSRLILRFPMNTAKVSPRSFAVNRNFSKPSIRTDNALIASMGDDTASLYSRPNWGISTPESRIVRSVFMNYSDKKPAEAGGFI